MGWYRCEAVVSSIVILLFSSRLRSYLFFRVLWSYILSYRLVQYKPRRFLLYIWIYISKLSPLSAITFCTDHLLYRLFFRPFRSRIFSRAINTHSSQSSLFKRFEVYKRSREFFVASGTISRWLGIDIRADDDSRPLQRGEWARSRHINRSSIPEASMLGTHRSQSELFQNLIWPQRTCARWAGRDSR
jgi:hypothetical protein